MLPPEVSCNGGAQYVRARECPRLLQDLQGATAQRDPVLAIPRRARGRDASHALIAVSSGVIEASVKGEGEGSGGGDWGARGNSPRVGEEMEVPPRYTPTDPNE